MAINITGTSGPDRLNDNPNSVESVNVVGLGGNDTIFGSSNADTLYGNTGNDLVFGRGRSDTVYAGQGNDLVFVTGNQTSTAEAPLAVRSYVEGGLGQDTIFVGGQVQTFFGLPVGVDGNYLGEITVLGGNSGSDPNDDADLINVRLGLNSSADIYGNGGNDRIIANAQNRTNAGDVSSQFYIHGGQGNDFISGSIGTGSTVLGGIGADRIDVSAANSVTVYGGNGNADAADDNDLITVDLGRDGLQGSTAVPTASIFGNGGNDTITLNTGNVAARADIYGGQGADVINVNGTGLASNSYVAGGLGADTINAVVSGSNVSIVGGNGTEDPTDGRDVINVNLTQDTSSAIVFGNGGDDLITFSGTGSVTAFGGAGDDTFNVGANAAGMRSVVLTGGIGSDLYDIDVNAAANGNAPIVRITDFDFNEDRLQGDRATSLRQEGLETSDLAGLRALAGQATGTTAVLITVQSGELAGTYLGYQSASGDQLINITGYTGTADSDIFVA